MNNYNAKQITNMFTGHTLRCYYTSIFYSRDNLIGESTLSKVDGADGNTGTEKLLEFSSYISCEYSFFPFASIV